MTFMLALIICHYLQKKGSRFIFYFLTGGQLMTKSLNIKNVTIIFNDPRSENYPCSILLR